MAVIKPFRALRFNSGMYSDIKNLISPPYDIVSSSKYEDCLSCSEYNIIRLELPKGKKPYDTAKLLLKEWISSGILKRDDKDSIYIYEEEFKISGITKRIKGVICLVKLEGFSKKVVLPHEETLSKAKEDRLNLMKATSCNFSSIYSMYIDEQDKTDNLIDSVSSRKPDIETTDTEGLIHRIWQVTSTEVIFNIQQQFENRKLYIADGHHRYETAINYRDYCRENGFSKEGDPADYVMMMLVSMSNEGLVVFPTHRLIRNIDKFDYKKIISICKEHFEIEEISDISSIESRLNLSYKENKKSFAFYCGTETCFLMTLKDNIDVKRLLPGLSLSMRSLDVTILHKLILEKAFCIDAENMKNQLNLTYTRGIKEAIDSVDSSESQCAFIINPTRVTQIRDVALNGEKMPQKSTYFYPKLITGIIMNQIDITLISS